MQPFKWIEQPTSVYSSTLSFYQRLIDQTAINEGSVTNDRTGCIDAYFRAYVSVLSDQVSSAILR